MAAASRSRVAQAACWILACWALAACGCAGSGGKSPPLPGSDAAKEVVYEPPAPLAVVPQGEPRPEKAEGWDKYSFAHVNETFRDAFGQGASEQISRLYYSQADDLYRQKKYHDAAKKYEAAAYRLPDSTLEEDATFMAGESHFFADEYSKCEDSYEAVVKKYPNTPHLNTIVLRQFSMALYWQKYDAMKPAFVLQPNFFDKTRPMFDTWGNAMRAYDNVRINDPRGALADEAIMASGNANFLRHHWEEADFYYKLVRSDYPKSKHQLDAHLLGIQAKLRRYQGPGYDQRPLKESEELIDQTLAQFGPELGDERTRLVTAKAEVHAQFALSSYYVAQRYEKNQYYAAARMYYNDIVKTYPQTKLAEEAKTRLVAIQPLPDVPVDHFKFLRDVFDGPDPETVVARAAGLDDTVKR